MFVVLNNAHFKGVGLICGGGKMISARGTKTVSLQRKKSGLDFSVKGGKEHGIPIVVSWIKENGAAGASNFLHAKNGF